MRLGGGRGLVVRRAAAGVGPNVELPILPRAMRGLLLPPGPPPTPVRLSVLPNRRLGANVGRRGEEDFGDVLGGGWAMEGRPNFSLPLVLLARSADDFFLEMAPAFLSKSKKDRKRSA
jgi:hypothetical protein